MGEVADKAATASGYQAEAMLHRAEWALSVYSRFDRAAVLRVAAAAALASFPVKGAVADLDAFLRRERSLGPREAAIGTTGTPSECSSVGISISMPSVRAESIMFRARMTGRPVSMTCIAR